MNNLFKYHYLNIVTSSIYFLKSLQDMTFLQLSLVTWRKKKKKYCSQKQVWFTSCHQVDLIQSRIIFSREPTWKRTEAASRTRVWAACSHLPEEPNRFIKIFGWCFPLPVGLGGISPPPQYIHLYQYKRCFKIIPWTSGGASTFWFFRRSMCSTACEGKKKLSSIIIMLSYKSFMWNFHIF